MIITLALNENIETKLLKVLKNNMETIAWSIEDIKGISPSVCMHKIQMEEEYTPSVEYRRQLNPIMKEVTKREVLKWLHVGFICAISDSPWVSPVQIVPKNGGMTVVKNNKDELISTRIVT